MYRKYENKQKNNKKFIELWFSCTSLTRIESRPRSLRRALERRKIEKNLFKLLLGCKINLILNRDGQTRMKINRLTLTRLKPHSISLTLIEWSLCLKHSLSLLFRLNLFALFIHFTSYIPKTLTGGRVGLQCDQMLKLKVAQSFPKVAQKSHSSFFLKSDAFK